MCLLFETIRVENGSVMNLDWHYKRMAHSLKLLFGIHFFHVHSEKQINRKMIVNQIKLIDFPEGLSKCKLVYNHSGIVDVQISSYAGKSLQTFQLVENNKIEYAHKFLDRQEIEELFSKRKAADDVMIVKNGLIADTSIANLVFYDGKNYFTPDKPLLPGTHRARLLASGLIKEKRITLEDLKKYGSFMPVNAMSEEGFDDMRDIGQILY